MLVSTKSRTVQMIGSSCSGANGGAWSGATIAIGSPVRWKRYTARICRSSAARRCMPNGSASISAAAGAARSVIRSSIRMGLPTFSEGGRGSIPFGQRKLSRALADRDKPQGPARIRGFHGLPSAPVFDGYQPLLHRRGSHARLQGRGVRHAIRAVPRPTGSPQGHRPRLRPDLDLGGKTGDVVRHPGLPGKGPAQADPVPVGAEGPRGHARALGPSGRRGRAARVPEARRLGFADSGPRVTGGLRIASARSAKATSRWTPDAMSRTVALAAFSSFSPSNTAYRAPIAFA